MTSKHHHTDAHLYFFFMATPASYGSSLLQVNSELQLRPIPQQRRIRASFVTYAAAWGNTRSLTHRVSPGIEPTSSQALSQVLNLLSHKENSCPSFLNRGFFLNNSFHLLLTYLKKIPLLGFLWFFFFSLFISAGHSESQSKQECFKGFTAKFWLWLSG